MLKVKFSNKKVSSNVKEGQVRYNRRGTHVLIVKRDSRDTFRAYVLSDKDSDNLFGWNTRDQDANTIHRVYPYKAESELNIYMDEANDES